MTFSNSSIDSKFWFLNVQSGTFRFTKKLKVGIFECCFSLTSQFSPIHEGDGHLGFLNTTVEIAFLIILSDFEENLSGTVGV